MAFCPNCGAQTPGRFCPNCGAEAGGRGGSSSTGSRSGYVPPSSGINVPGLTRNLASALCYLLGFITGIIFLLVSPYKNDRTIRFHAFQSIFLSVAVIALDFVLGILTGIFYAVHAGGLAMLFWRLYQLALFAGWVYLMYSAYTDRKIIVPIVGPLAQKQA